MEKLLKISFAVSLVGILFLLFLQTQINPRVISIKNITEDNLNERVAVIGNITKVANFEEKDFQILTLKDATGTIEVVSNSKIPLEKMENVVVIGKIQEYNNTLQINADKILNSSALP